MKKLIPSLAALLLASSASAADYEIGNPVVSGPGCPNGTVSASVAPDGSAISLLFDNFRLDIPKGTIATLKKTCTFAIPIKVAPGMVVQATTIDYRGFASIPRRTTAALATTGPIFYRGSAPNASTNLGLTDGDFLISHTVNQRIARCEPQNELRFNTTISLGGSGGRIAAPVEADAMINVDSADTGGDAIRLGLRVSRCTR